ncbi:MAG: DUF169 domain-containing protein [Spirochaetes bacterium]|nr:DUF169 domain-containing protein [Spirochaetota bacterium]
MSIDKFKSYGKELEEVLQLRTSPLAIKFLKTETDIPEGAIRPKKDLGEHLALCQAFAMSRRSKQTVAMFAEDHWCWAPLIGFGLVEPHDFFMSGNAVFPFMVKDLEKAKKLAEEFPMIEKGKYAGIVSAPLSNTGYEPDLVYIYCNSGQLRTMLLSVKYTEGELVHSSFDPIDSCVYSIVPVLLNREYRITMPDPGEYERALATEDEIIFSLPQEKLENLVMGLRHFAEMNLGYNQAVQVMRPNFPRPDFYKKLFKDWGLDEE